MRDGRAHEVVAAVRPLLGVQFYCTGGSLYPTRRSLLLNVQNPLGLLERNYFISVHRRKRKFLERPQEVAAVR